MSITKEALLKMADSQTQTVPIDGNGTTVVIKRIKLSERNKLLALNKDKSAAMSDLEHGLLLSRAIIAACMVEPVITPEEVDELPAAVAEVIAKAAMDLNGWSKEGQAVIADHFRPPS
jgi:hypothetical protein